MMKTRSRSFLVSVFGFAALAAGCSTAPANSGGTGGGQSSTGGSSGGGGTGGGQVVTGVAVPLTPSASGFVAVDSNPLGVMGPWFAYGDGYEMGMPPGKCQGSGHATAECSKITAPTLPPGTAGFPPNAAGAMCTEGTAAKVIPIPGMPTVMDYSNMFGAGIGLDLNNPGGASVKGPFDAVAKRVTGISFDIDAPPLSGLRVEFPTAATDSSVAGSDYWGATPDGKFPNSKVMAGTNTIHWSDVNTPAAPVAGAPPHMFMPNGIESIQFHVPTNVTTSSTYKFCISNLKLLM